jgi:DNA-binding NarL/FixJ family response regulator
VVHILIADDHKSVRDNIRSFLEEQQPHWRVSEASNGQQAIDLFQQTTPDVAVLDIVMEPIGGIAAAYEIQRTHPETKIIFISNHYNVGEASVVTRLLGAGAFVPKTDAVRSLIPTIKKLLDPDSQPV